jgi:hypothetical protein
LNRDFGQVLADLARLRDLGVFPRGIGSTLRVVVQHTRAWANQELVEVLQPLEQDERTWFGRVYDQWESRLKDPNDVLIEAKQLLEKRRKEAARKKERRKPRGAGSKCV